MGDRIRDAEVARRLAQSERKIQGMAAQGLIPSATKIDGEWMFDPCAVERWVKSQEAPMPKILPFRKPEPKHVTLARKAARLSIETCNIVATAHPWPAARCGIYFLISEGVVVYVGQAVNVVARIAQHAETRQFDAWNWVDCPRKQLDVMERAYINALMPKLNMDPITVRMRREAANISPRPDALTPPPSFIIGAELNLLPHQSQGDLNG